MSMQVTTVIATPDLEFEMPRKPAARNTNASSTCSRLRARTAPTARKTFLSRSEIAMISEVGADRFLSVEKCIVGYRKLPRSSGPLAMVRKHLCAAYLLERHQRSNVAAASRG